METSNEQFKQFKHECQRWINFFNLGDWEVDYIHEESEDGEDGSCGSDYAQKYARIKLSDNINYDDETPEGITEYISRVAFHEVCELLLAEVRQVSIFRYASPEMIENALHGVIARLTNGIYRRMNDGNIET